MTETAEKTAIPTLPATELTIVVGCGGLLYHSMSGLACEKRCRGLATHWIFIDDDEIEERNGLRQHGLHRMRCKVHATEGLALSHGLMSSSHNHIKVKEPKEVVDIVQGTAGSFDRTIILALPDNDDCRIVCAQAALQISETVDDTWYITAGNNPAGGQVVATKLTHGAWSCPDLVDLWDLWTPDRGEKQGVVHCDQQVEQTLIGNMNTASLIVDALRALRLGASYFERYWYETPQDVLPGPLKDDVDLKKTKLEEYTRANKVTFVTLHLRGNSTLG